MCWLLGSWACRYLATWLLTYFCWFRDCARGWISYNNKKLAHCNRRNARQSPSRQRSCCKEKWCSSGALTALASNGLAWAAYSIKGRLMRTSFASSIHWHAFVQDLFCVTLSWPHLGKQQYSCSTQAKMVTQIAIAIWKKTYIRYKTKSTPERIWPTNESLKTTHRSTN